MMVVELMMCISDFCIRNFSFSARKRERSYVGEFMSLTTDMRGLSGLCIFGRPYKLGGRGFVGFNVNLILLRKLLFSIRVLVFCANVFVGSLSSFVYALSDRRVFTFFL